VDLRLYGGFWERDQVLRPLARGFAYGRDYRLAIGGSKIALSLVRHANRDRHAMRTFEIAACGGFILADRTEEHLEFLEEDREAVFFGGADELLDKVRFYLPREEARRTIAEAGHRRITTGGHTWADRVNELMALAAAAR
jgi:spore maturation protein CgeB